MRAGKQLRNVSAQPIYWFLNTISPTANVAPKGNPFDTRQVEGHGREPFQPAGKRFPHPIGRSHFPQGRFQGPCDGWWYGRLS